MNKASSVSRSSSTWRALYSISTKSWWIQCYPSTTLQQGKMNFIVAGCGTRQSRLRLTKSGTRRYHSTSISSSLLTSPKQQSRYSSTLSRTKDCSCSWSRTNKLRKYSLSTASSRRSSWGRQGSRLTTYGTFSARISTTGSRARVESLCSLTTPWTRTT